MKRNILINEEETKEKFKLSLMEEFFSTPFPSFFLKKIHSKGFGSNQVL